MIDFKAEIKQVAGELYKIALDYMDEEEARDLFISITKRGRGKRGFGRNPFPAQARRPNESALHACVGSSPSSSESLPKTICEGWNNHFEID
jgi:hypothetical protein